MVSSACEIWAGSPKKLKHKLAVLLLSGMLLFVFHVGSRREANREMSRPMFLSNLKESIPELESLPHQDTLNRLLDVIEVERIEQSHVELLRRLMQHKKFNRYVIEQCCPLFRASVCSYTAFTAPMPTFHLSFPVNFPR